MSGVHNAGWMRRAVLAAVIAVSCVPVALAHGQHPNAPRFAHAPGGGARPRAGRPQANPRIYQDRPGGAQQRPVPGYAGPGQVYRGGGPYASPVRPGYVYPGAAPAGHLGAWLNEHRGLSVEQQERVLRNDPNFYRLAPEDQQRVVQQLHQINQMPEEQRERRLARAEALEHMSPQDQMSVNLSAQRLRALPPDRQTMVRHAFRDLSAVPVDQRETVLNSARYQGVFSPDERSILSNLLRVEPYEPQQ